MATTSEQLAQVQQAISDIMTTGQSYAFDGQTVTRANLRDLEAREQTLLRRLSRENRVKPRYATADFRNSD